MPNGTTSIRANVKDNGVSTNALIYITNAWVCRQLEWSLSTTTQEQYNAVQETMFEYIPVNSFVEDPIKK